MTAITSFTGVGYSGAAPTEKYLIALPREGIKVGSPWQVNPSVIWCHGRAGDAFQGYAAPNYTYEVALAIVKAGYVYMAIDAGGPTRWGNDTAQARIMDAIGTTMSLGAGTGRPGGESLKHIVMGMSMGALTAINFADKHPEYCKGAIGIVPPIDLPQVSGLQSWDAEIAGMLGADWKTNQATLNDFSPKHALANTADPFQTPIQTYYSTTDPLCLPQTIIDFGNGIGRPARSLGAVGHYPYQAGLEDDIVGVINEFAGN